MNNAIFSTKFTGCLSNFTHLAVSNNSWKKQAVKRQVQSKFLIKVPSLVTFPPTIHSYTI